MSSKPVVVLLPGLDGTGRLFDRLLAECPQTIDPRVVSYPADRVLGYRELEDLVLAELPERDPFVVVAESFSGPLAVALASRGLGNLVGVVLAASFVTPPRARIWRWAPWRTVFRFPAPLSLLRRLLTPTDRELAQELRAAAREVSPHVLAERVRATLSVDNRNELRRAECALLYIRARRDRIVPKRCLREILAVRDDVTVEVINAPHPVLQCDSVAAWRVIERFAYSTIDDLQRH